MKRTILLLIISMILLQKSFSQSIIPAARTFRLDRARFISDYKSNPVIDTASIMSKIIAKTKVRYGILSNKDITSDKSDSAKKAFEDLVNSAFNTYTDSLRTLDVLALIDTLNKRSPVEPIVTAGVTNLENTKQAYGSLSFGVQFRLSKHKRIGKNWIDPQYLYLMFSAKTATSPDSSSIQKTFMFPELNKRDFVLGYFWNFIREDWTVAPTFEFSLNRFVDTAIKKSFVSQSFNLGCRVQKSFVMGKQQSFVSLYPYYSLITVDKKYATDYKLLIGEPTIPSTFHSVGLHISAQIPNAILFCNMKYILNKEGDLQSRDLKRYIYTIGTLLAL